MSAYWYYLAEAAVALEIRISGSENHSEADGIKASGQLLDADLIDSYKSSVPVAEIESRFKVVGLNGASQLKQDLMSFLEEISTLSFLYSPVDHAYYLNLGLSVVEQHSAIAFRLAILKSCLPFEYKRTLFCLWQIIFEAEQSQREDVFFIDFFLCGLCHDLGLLEVNPKFTRQDHDPRSSKDDIHGYYSHVHYSSLFLSKVRGVSDGVLKSIEQHHENMDGTGYPDGKAGNQLAEFGQFIHLFDTLYSIYMKNYKPLGKLLADLIPLIEINAITHFGQGAMRVVELLKQAPRSNDVFFTRGELKKVQSEADAMAEFIERSVGIIQVFTSSVGFRHDDKSLFVLQNSFIHIALAHYKLRINHKQAMIADALAEDGEYRKLSRALEDHFFSSREIIFHINKFLYRLRIYSTSCRIPMVKEKTEETIEALSALNLKLLT